MDEVDHSRASDYAMKKQDLRRPLIKLLWHIGSWASPLFDRPLKQDRIQNILVFQGGGIGDVIRLFPAIEALRSAFPNARMATLTQFGDTLFRYLRSPDHRFEHIIYDLKSEHDSFPGKMRLVRSLRRRNFDLIFSPNYGLGMIEAMILAYLMRAPFRLGYDKEGAGFLYTTKKDISSEQCLQEQHVELLSKGGVHIEKRGGPCFGIPVNEVLRGDSLLQSLGVSERDLVIVVAPEVKSGETRQSFPECRTWPVDRYRSLILELIRNYKDHHPKVIVLGRGGGDLAKEEGSLFPSDSELPPEVLDLSGKTTIAEAVALISRSRLFIGNDSGLLHIAVATETPTVAIFGATSHRQVIPFSDRTIVVRKDMPCSPCFFHAPLLEFSCPYDTLCLRSIEVADVMVAVEKLLKTGPLGPRNPS
jgi:heptosyltransferase-2